MKTELIAMYAKCRHHKPFMLVGRDAECSLDAARTILAFRKSEADGLVRMRAEQDEDCQIDFDPGDRNGHPLSDKEWENQKQEWYDMGIVGTISEWFDGEDWQEADSCWGHIGYKNPLDPFENCYVVQEMQAALDALAEHESEQQETVKHYDQAFSFAA